MPARSGYLRGRGGAERALRDRISRWRDLFLTLRGRTVLIGTHTAQLRDGRSYHPLDADSVHRMSVFLTNTAMCQISEDVIFDEPFLRSDSPAFSAQALAWRLEQIWHDSLGFARCRCISVLSTLARSCE